MRTLPIVAQFLAALTMGLAMAHALELPGKLRLDKRGYKAVQGIYYPGFTLGGLVGEVGGLIAMAMLVYLTPLGTNRSWWFTAALLFMAATHATYWIMTHPTNYFWAKDVVASAPVSRFFSVHRGDQQASWKDMRNVWEISHVIRACLAALSFLSITTAISGLPHPVL